MLEAVLAILLMSMASYGLAMTSALQFNQLEAKQVANEAEQYAMNEVEYLRRVGFDDLDEALHDRKSNLEFSGVDGWESVTSFVTEKAIDDDRSIKIAKVEVYKEGENIPRYSMEVPLSSQGGSGSSGPAPAVDWEHGQTLSSGSAVPEDGVVKSGTFSAYFGGIAGTLTSYTNLVINGVQVKSGGRIAYYAHGGVKPNEYIHTPDPSPTAHFYVKKGDIVISYGSADSNLKGNPHGTIYGNYKFYPLRKK